MSQLEWQPRLPRQRVHVPLQSEAQARAAADGRQLNPCDKDRNLRRRPRSRVDGITAFLSKIRFHAFYAAVIELRLHKGTRRALQVE